MRASALAAAVLALSPAAWACRPRAQEEAEKERRLSSLRETNARLHERLETAVGRDPVTSRAFADEGQVIVAVRSPLLQDLGARIAHSYLARVSLDLADLEAHAGGEVHKKMLGSKVKIGDWRVEVLVDRLRGTLRAGVPEIRPEGADRLRVRIPVDVLPSRGRVGIQLSWDSAALANVVCKDFELARDLDGRVLGQRHFVEGAFKVSFEGEALVASPLFPERKLRLKLDLTPESWQTVEAALRSQDTLGRCGLLMNPEQAMERLRALAEQGIDVKLPDELFRSVELPARVVKAVTIADRPVELDAEARGLRFVPGMLWSSASMHIRSVPGHLGTIYEEGGLHAATGRR